MKKNPAFTQAIVVGCFSPSIEIYIPLIETEKVFYPTLSSIFTSLCRKFSGKISKPTNHVNLMRTDQ